TISIGPTRHSAHMDDLECEICCYIYDEAKRRPKNLGCGHTFCASCMTKEISNGKTTCPTCRQPHNAHTVADLPFSVVLERMVRNRSKSLNVGTKSSDSEDEGEDDDYSAGPCSKHKKSIVYFFCQSHSLPICRECTVIDHPPSTCKINSFKEEVQRRKDKNISEASSTFTAINDKLTDLGEFVKENDKIISNEELKIQKWRKEIEDATKTIDYRRTANDKAECEIAKGKVQSKNMEAAKLNLEKSATKKTIIQNCNNVETLSTNVKQWMNEVNKKYDLHKITPLGQNTPSPANILKDISNGMDIYAETTINGTRSMSKLTSKDG
ncbi:unnamed protein product, partial [Meganyctiphanes norvegica]